MEIFRKMKIFQLMKALTAKVRTRPFIGTSVLGTSVLISALVSLCACSLDEHIFRQDRENRGDSKPIQDQAVSHEIQGISSSEAGPSQGQAAISSWRLPQLEQLPVIGETSSEVVGVFTPLRPPTDEDATGNRDTILVVTRSGEVLLFHVPTGQKYRLLKLPDNLSQVAFFRDSALLAVAHQQVVEIWSLSQARVLYTLNRLNTRINSLDFHPQGQSLVIGASDGRVYRWNFFAQEATASAGEEYKILERYYGHSSVVSAVALHPYGRIFFSGDWAGTLSAFLIFDKDLFLGEYDPDLFGGRYLSKSTPRANAPRPDTVSIVKILVSHTGKELYVAMQDGRVELWDVRGFEKRAEGLMHKGLIYDLVISPQGGKLASAGRDGRVLQWSFVASPDPKLPPTAVIDFEVRTPMVSRLVFLDDDRLMAGNAIGQMFEVKRP